MCGCGVVTNDLVVKVGADGFDELLVQPHARAFDFTDRPMVGVLYVGAGGVSTDQDLRSWVQRALDFAAANPKQSPRPARREKARSGAKRE